jgi:hypothetical protein
VEVFDPAISTRWDPIPVGSGPVGLDFNAASSKLVVCCGDSSFLKVLDMTAVPPIVSAWAVADPTLLSWARPSLVGVAANEKAFFTYSSGFGPLRELDLVTNLVSARADYSSASYPLYLRASGDRSRLSVGESSGALRIYTSSSNAFTSPLWTGGLSNVDANADGSRFLISGGPKVYDSTPALLGAVSGFPDRACFRQGAGTAGYSRSTTQSIAILDLMAYSQTGTFLLPESPDLYGGMISDAAGTHLIVVTTTGIAIVDLP